MSLNRFQSYGVVDDDPSPQQSLSMFKNSRSKEPPSIPKKTAEEPHSLPRTTLLQPLAKPAVSIIPDDKGWAEERTVRLPRHPDSDTTQKITSKGPIRKRMLVLAAREDVEEEEIPSKNGEAGGLQYKDYSQVSITDIGDLSAFPSASPSAKDPPFPVKLHRILANPEFSDIIAWLPHGRSWRVLKPKVFEESVIPVFFRHCRYSSFMRQVNGWGFRRVYQGKELNSYYHEIFLRGLPHLCLKMRRPNGKQVAQSRFGSGRAPIPDFCAISEKHPLPEYKTSPETEEAMKRDAERFSASVKACENTNSISRQGQDVLDAAEEPVQTRSLPDQQQAAGVSSEFTFSEQQPHFPTGLQESERLVALQQEALMQQSLRNQALAAPIGGAMQSPHHDELSVLQLISQRKQLQRERLGQLQRLQLEQIHHEQLIQSQQHQLGALLHEGRIGGMAGSQAHTEPKSEVEHLRHALRASQLQNQILAATMANSLEMNSIGASTFQLPHYF